MSHPITAPVPMVSPRGVAKASVALFATLGGLLTPLVAQSLGGRAVTPVDWIGSALMGAVVFGLVGRKVVRADVDSAGAALRMIPRGAVLGALGGALLLPGLLLASSYTGGHLGVMALFGAIYGALTGVVMAFPAAVWCLRAHRALEGGAAVDHERLTIDAGAFLAVAGAFGLALYRIEALSALSLGLVVAGVVTVLAATLRTARLTRLLDAVQDGSLKLHEATAVGAPALVGVPGLDRVIVHEGAPVDGTPFRANVPGAVIARVPADLNLVRAGIGRTVRAGIVTAVALVALSFAGIGFTLTIGCASGGCASGGAASGDCGGCAH